MHMSWCSVHIVVTLVLLVVVVVLGCICVILYMFDSILCVKYYNITFVIIKLNV